MITSRWTIFARGRRELLFFLMMQSAIWSTDSDKGTLFPNPSKYLKKNNTKHEGRLFNPKVVKISLLSSSEFWGWKCRWDSLDDVQRLWKVIQLCLGMSRFCLESKLAECSVIFQQFLTKGREENLVVWHVCSVLSILCQRLWHIRTSQVTGLMSQS